MLVVLGSYVRRHADVTPLGMSEYFYMLPEEKKNLNLIWSKLFQKCPIFNIFQRFPNRFQQAPKARLLVVKQTV
jgi:hypothetical protein